ncbi:MAG: hypothetical protein JJT77_05965 [Crocinitomicaceae bacterium]|nr:hypothetical protein [Crocinitomicaceae bacterium]
MLTIHPQYIKDNSGKKMVVLLKKEFDSLMDLLDELEDISIYDEVKKNDDGKRIKFSDYLKKRKIKDA